MLTTFVREEDEIISVRPDDFSASAAKLAALAVIDGMAVYYYGLRALLLIILCAGVCWAADALCLILRGKPLHIHDLSALTTGLTIAAMLPASVSHTAAAAACIFAICIAKHPLGSSGTEIFSCAAVGYIFAELNFPQYVLSYPKPFQKLSMTDIVPEVLSPSLSKSLLTGSAPLSGYELLIGKFCGPMGASLTVMVIVCAAFLIGMKAVSPAVFFSEMAVVIIGFCGFGKAPLMSVLAGGMMTFTAVFITGDMRYAPQKFTGRILYGVFCGLLVIAISKISTLENPAVYAAVIFAPVSRLADRLMVKRRRRKRVRNIFGQNSEGEASADE